MPRRPRPAKTRRSEHWLRVMVNESSDVLDTAIATAFGWPDTVMRGGDTDTNAAICGALLGAVHGLEAVPTQWKEKVLSCRPEQHAGVAHPRPEVFWPVDALELAQQLME